MHIQGRALFQSGSANLCLFQNLLRSDKKYFSSVSRTVQQAGKCFQKFPAVRTPRLFFCSYCVKNNHANFSLSVRSLWWLNQMKIRNLYTNTAKQFRSREAELSKGKVSGGEKPSIVKSSEVVRLLSLAKTEKWNLAGAVCLLLVSSAVTMAIPFCLGKVIDLIYTSDPVKMRENLNKLCLALVGIFLVGGLCNFGRVYLMSVSGQRITARLRTKLFDSVVKQEVAFFDKNRTGELINRLSADSALVSQSVTMNISDGLRSSVMVAAGVSMMFYVSPQLAMVGLSVVPPVAAMAVVYGRYVKNITKSVQDALADATQTAEERISNIRTVKAFSRENKEIEHYSQKIQNVLGLTYKESLARGIFFGLTGLSGNLIILSVLYYGGVMVTGQHISVGNLSAFLLYAAYIGVSIGGLTSFYSEMMRGLGASTRLWELIDREPRVPVTGGIIPTSEPEGGIVFENIKFSYPSRSDSTIFDGLGFHVKPSSVTAIVGPSGSGKSTLAALLLRFYDPDHGTVFLDRYKVDELDPDWLRKYIGTVSQEPVLFSSTIKENILYGADEPHKITHDQLVAVAKEANAYSFISEFPDGFDTKVGERGVMLSGGQKQRIAIARALMKNPKILLLDEATSALDAESEHLVQEALEKIMKGRTVLTIAHRLSTIKNADQIVVLDKGAVAEKGTYDELMSQDGVFKKLVKHQTVKNS